MEILIIVEESYFEGIPNTETLLPLCLENYEVAKYSYKELDI